MRRNPGRRGVTIALTATMAAVLASTTVLGAARAASAAGPTSATGPTTATGSTSAAAQSSGRRLQSAVDDLHRLGITGVQGFVRVDGSAARARAGVGDLARGTPVPFDGYFRMGSNTKTFISVVALQLVGEGRLSLDDTVERWLPGTVAGNGNDGSRITVRNLLQHTSGLYNYTNDLAAFEGYQEFLAHRYDHYDAADLVALAMKHEPGFAPGTGWDYSNTNYILAGMIIERVTGRPWAAEVRTRILQPLGLRRTSAPGDRASLPDPHAEGYQQWAPDGALTDTTRFNPTAADAAGSLITTPTDLARFWQALQRGQLLKPHQMAQMHETVLADTFQDILPGVRYGLGIMYLPNRCGGYWSHGGDVPGTQTVNGVSADGDRVAVLSLTTELADGRPVYDRSFRIMDDVICGPA